MAARADTHLFIEKQSIASGAFVRTQVKPLDGGARKEEIARMHKLLSVSLLLLLAGAAPAFAYDTPADLMKALYSHYTDAKFDWNTFDEATVRSKALNALFDKDSKEANGEVGRIDFDPYVDGQDYEVKDLKIGEPTIKGDTATIEVTFKNFDMRM